MSSTCVSSLGYDIDHHASLTVRFQTELAVNTNVIISDVRRDVQNTHAAISELQRDVTSTLTVISNIQRAVVRGRDETDDQHSVSITCIMFVPESTLTIH